MHHPRNRHSGRYDFAALTQACPDLARFVRANPAGEPTIDFADPAAVRWLNRALLRRDYGVSEWSLPDGYLCPPIPGRADYLHHLADLLAEGGSVPRGSATRILDIGTGANLVYPLVGVADYGWTFVGTEVDAEALASGRRILEANPDFERRIELRRQPERGAIFAGVVKPGETFAACLCNPPFHASAAEAAAGTRRKLRNLAGNATGPSSRTAGFSDSTNSPSQGDRAPPRNFAGRSHELWCPGGEVAFIRRMIRESALRPALCRWFTSLVSQRESLEPLQRTLHDAGTVEVRRIDLAHGQKRTRLLAWRFAA